MFELQIYRRVIFPDSEEKLTCGLKNWLRNFANFHQSTWKCQNWDFAAIFLSKVEKVWPKNLQRNYVSWQWVMMQRKMNLKRNWIVISKLHEEFNEFWLEHSKIFKKLLFHWLLWPKYIMFGLRKVQRSYVWWHWRLMRNLKEK